MMEPVDQATDDDGLICAASVTQNRPKLNHAWLETCLIPELKPGQKLVIDNATFHKGGRIQALVEAVGCEIWYLPAYSPDFNKIEQQWATLKSQIRKQLDQWPTLRDAIEHVLRLAS